MAEKELFSVEDLRLYFRTNRGPVQAVDRVTFDLQRGKTMVILGESGCGKSSLARGILRLLPKNVERYSGKVILNGSDVMQLSEERFRREVRWLQIAMVPQAAMNALNPVAKVEDQVSEPLLVHGRAEDRAEALAMAREKFALVGVPSDFASRYPFELSGGMRQRCAIAMSLVTDPDLVILDEPTSALDLLTQANIMNVLKRIKSKINVTYILITHDIATSSELADCIGIMYAGNIVEQSDAHNFFDKPLHPYSEKLMASVPTLRDKKALEYIPGQPPSLLNPPAGCRFAERCTKRFSRCDEDPPMVIVDEGRRVKCWLYR